MVHAAVLRDSLQRALRSKVDFMRVELNCNCPTEFRINGRSQRDSRASGVDARWPLARCQLPRFNHASELRADAADPRCFLARVDGTGANLADSATASDVDRRLTGSLNDK